MKWKSVEKVEIKYQNLYENCKKKNTKLHVLQSYKILKTDMHCTQSKQKPNVFSILTVSVQLVLCVLNNVMGCVYQCFPQTR